MKTMAVGEGILWRAALQRLRESVQRRIWITEEVREQRRIEREEKICQRREKLRQRRETIRQRNEPPVLTRKEECFNTVSHGLGALMASVCTGLLLVRADTAFKLAAALVYGISMILMMLMSAVYHAMPEGSGAKRLCRRFDYTSIYLLIGGTFAPVLLVYLGGKTGMILFAVQWCVILAGVALVLAFGPGHWRGLLFTLYFLLGWSGLALIPSFWKNAPMLLWFILMGGVIYTAGMIPFVRQKKYDHCVWHVFVLAAAVIHWLGIYTQLY